MRKPEFVTIENAEMGTAVSFKTTDRRSNQCGILSAIQSGSDDLLSEQCSVISCIVEPSDMDGLSPRTVALAAHKLGCYLVDAPKLCNGQA